MREKEHFMQAQMMLLVLTAMAVFVSRYPYLCIFQAGLLMFVFTMRSLAEQQSRILLAIQVLLSAVFTFAVGGVFSYLIFYECRVGNRRQHILFPSLAYGIGYLINKEESLPRIVFHMLLLTVIAAIINLMEGLLVSYIDVKNQISHAVSVTAVNEMYEKKLNRELVIKNYLADKNARLEERENITRNIHNSVGHSITAAIMTLDAADMLFERSPDQAREKMNAANQRIRESLGAIRHAVRVLDVENELIAMADFIAQLYGVIDSFVMDTTIDVRTDFSETGTNLCIPRNHTEFLTGALQEFLTNGVRHGKASIFHVSLTADSGHLKLVVLDNGRSDFGEENGQQRIQNGFGLKKLISYVERCGGELVFGNVNGFKAELTLPLTE